MNSGTSQDSHVQGLPHGTFEASARDGALGTNSHGHFSQSTYDRLVAQRESGANEHRSGHYDDYQRAPRTQRSSFFSTVIQQSAENMTHTRQSNHLDVYDHPIVPSNAPPSVTRDDLDLEYYDPATGVYGTCPSNERYAPTLNDHNIPPSRSHAHTPLTTPTRALTTPMVHHPTPTVVPRTITPTSHDTTTATNSSAPKTRKKPVPKAKQDLIAKSRSSTDTPSRSQGKSGDAVSDIDDEPVESNKRKRGGRKTGAINYNDDDIERLLRCIRKREPYGQRGWSDVVEDFNTWATKHRRPERNVKSLSGKFFKLVNAKPPTGKGEIPPDVAEAKNIIRIMEGKIEAGEVSDNEIWKPQDNEASADDSDNDEVTTTHSKLKLGSDSDVEVVSKPTKVSKSSSAVSKRRSNAAKSLLEGVAKHFDPKEIEQRHAAHAETSMQRSAQLFGFFAQRDQREENQELRRALDQSRQELTEARLELQSLRHRFDMEKMQWQMQMNMQMMMAGHNGMHGGMFNFNGGFGDGLAGNLNNNGDGDENVAFNFN